MSKRKTERYPVERSGFYRLGAQRALAILLDCDLRKIKGAVANRKDLYWFKEEEINGKLRSIQRPIGLMYTLHKRLKNLVNRIDRPLFLHAPRHGSSYITNAQTHAASNVIAKLDIRRFYPSTTSEHVFQYFFHQLGMPSDVAGLLTKLCTIDERLPFGSPLSPILCFQVHRQMFTRIEELCRANGLVMTLYVDDIGISGDGVPNRVLYEVKKLIHNARLTYHKVRTRGRSRKPVVTGVQLSKHGSSPANRSHLRMKEKLEELHAARDPQDRLRVVNSLIGLNQHMLQVYSRDHSGKARAERQKTWLHNERRRLQRLIRGGEAPAVTGGPIPSSSDDTVPF